ncbi:MAG: DUF1062 domain-containing protein [Clostridium sp.]
MSYYIENKYKISPNKSYEIIKNCPKCGCKTNYINTNKFRVNANGNMLDVWLIYQCEKCKHTYNVSIYEREKTSVIDKSEYQKFLSNDLELAFHYGTSRELFLMNKAVIDEEKITYELLFEGKEEKHDDLNLKTNIIIRNPYKLKIRVDKVLSEILSISRNQIRHMIKNKAIYSDEYDKLNKIYDNQLLNIKILMED